jgi:mRNA interferase RelE/StbE
MLAVISDRRVQESIARRVDDLAVDPEKQGKPLLDDLAGYRSIRAVGQRYRIIYKVERARIIVIVVALGLRRSGGGKDIYALAQKLVRLRLLGSR